MANVAVVGAQWGDEGKGKIVDWLSERADVVVRFQGGHNAGHTLVIGNMTYKLSLLPSGVVRGKLSILGSGVVVDPWHLLAEIETLKGQGVEVTADTLRVAENCTLILPVHRILDLAQRHAVREVPLGAIHFHQEDLARAGIFGIGDFRGLATRGLLRGGFHRRVFRHRRTILNRASQLLEEGPAAATSG